MKLESLHELFLDELKDIYDAEHQITEALPRMEKAAHSAQLKQAFRASGRDGRPYQAP